MHTIILWHRRDLRLTDNTALNAALRKTTRIIPCFILADDILKEKDDFSPACVQFMLESLHALGEAYRERGIQFVVRRGRFLESILQIAKESGASEVFYNEDYEPEARLRDRLVTDALKSIGVSATPFKDQILFEADAIRSAAGTPYTVFTPYKRNWLSKTPDIPSCKTEPLIFEPHSVTSHPLPTVKELVGEHRITPYTRGGEKAGQDALSSFLEEKILRYKYDRDFPAIEGTSFLSAHLRFGTVSIREVYHRARTKYRDIHNGWAFTNYYSIHVRDAKYDENHPIWTNLTKDEADLGIETFISELIWRDFYFQILVHFPHVATGAFKKDLNNLAWETNDEYFEAWKNGQTGFPIVDAAMRQLKSTGWMHNRLRMIVASFLTKDLLINWQRGEKYFMQHLVDGDLAANNGGWQWSASTGTDAQPYFRIFNPTSQSEKFDPTGDFIRKFVPELAKVKTAYIHNPYEMAMKKPLFAKDIGLEFGKDYPKPIVEHSVQREKALRIFKK
ncbi:MAG: deoxyribodipyrimidine photo-lyase [Chloroherpetonaceae bacterium]|nr:deoxyribodipyrimidine photo-lyase [Chloroherpetonaceae bacterium]